jgi:hypothetical protein
LCIVVDDHSRLILACVIDAVFSDLLVVRELERLVAEYGKPNALVTDRGFTSKGIEDWATRLGVEWRCREHRGPWSAGGGPGHYMRLGKIGAQLKWPLATPDFEASALSRESYPIETGVSVWPKAEEPIATWSSSIRPADVWRESGHWDDASARIHGIVQAELFKALTCHCDFPPDRFRVRPDEGRTNEANPV